MRVRTFKKLLVFAVLCAFVLCAVFMGVSLNGIRQENEEMAVNDAELQAEVERLEREKAYKEEYYFRMIHDEKFAARVIRERMGYSSPKEIVFRFEDSRPIDVNDGVSSERSRMSEIEKAAKEEEERIIRAAALARSAQERSIAAEAGDASLSASGSTPIPEPSAPAEKSEPLLSTPLTFAPRPSSASSSSQTSQTSENQSSVPQSQSPRVDKRVDGRVNSNASRTSSRESASEEAYRNPDRPDGSRSKKHSSDIEKAIRISERRR